MPDVRDHLLPTGLSLKEVLNTKHGETKFLLNQSNAEEWASLRYELSTIYTNDHPGKTSFLSKMGSYIFKDFNKGGEISKAKDFKQRPPGIPVVIGDPNYKPKIEQEIWGCEKKQNQIYVRKKGQEMVSPNPNKKNLEYEKVDNDKFSNEKFLEDALPPKAKELILEYENKSIGQHSGLNDEEQETQKNTNLQNMKIAYDADPFEKFYPFQKERTKKKQIMQQGNTNKDPPFKHSPFTAKDKRIFTFIDVNKN